jgi:hypothetical protein
MLPASRELAGVRPLTAAFIARFFESDTTLERTDATRSFLWLLAMLAAPGILLSFYSQFSWELLARHRDGQRAFLLSARFDASLYLTLTFTAIAVVAAARWQSLVIDRRDALVLGILPIRARTIVAAKLAALATYTVVMAVGMHIGSSVVFGVSLGGLARPTNISGTFAAHLIAGAGLTVFMMAAISAVQSAGLAIAGPRRFARISSVLQMSLIGVVFVVFAAMPWKSPLAISTFDTAGVIGPPWVQWLPPLWFVGLFETVAGHAGPEMRDLARTGVVALLAALAMLALAAPIAGVRVLRATLDAAAVGRAPVARAAAAAITRALARQPPVRGALQFTLATLGRVSGPRLVLAFLVGVGLMGIVPVLAASVAAPDGVPEPTTMVLALPFVLVFFTQLALRLAIKTPAELGGRWLFDQTDVSPLAGRSAAWRLLFAFGILPAIAVTGVLWTLFWGVPVGLARTLSAFCGGLLVLEVLLYGYVGVPCSRPLVSDAFKGRTLALVVGFEVFCFESAAAQAGWQHRTGAVLVQAAIFAVLAAAVHVASRRAAALNAIVDEHLDPRLNLEVVGSLASHERAARG